MIPGALPPPECDCEVETPTDDQAVTLDSVRKVINTYFLPLFSPSTSIGAVSVSSGKADEVHKGFEELGFTVERKELPVLGDGDNESGSENGDENGSRGGSDEDMSGSGSDGEGEREGNDQPSKARRIE